MLEKKIKKLIIFGASGHAKVIIDMIEKQADYSIIGIIDNQLLKGSLFQGYKVLGDDGFLKDFDQSINKEFDKEISNLYCVVAIGNNEIRKKVAKNIIKECPALIFATIIHPSASIAKKVNIGSGTVIMSQAHIGIEATIGQHVIVNTGAIIEHECNVGDFSSLSPGVVLAGKVMIDENVFLGIGSKVIPELSIGQNTIIGAGSVVIHNLPPNVTAVGIPAKVKQNK